MTDIIPTAAEAKDLADDCCEALAELLSRPTTTARRPITQRVLAEMQKTLSDESWAEAIGSPIKTYLGFNSIHLCMRFLRSNGHLAQAARIEAASVGFGRRPGFATRPCAGLRSRSLKRAVPVVCR